MRLYLAGPMNGISDFNVPAFLEAQAQLEGVGHEVVSPVQDFLHEYQHPGSDLTTNTDTQEAHAAYLRRDIAMLLGVEAIALLPGWETSKGANIELAVARALALPVYLFLPGLKTGLLPSKVVPISTLMTLMFDRAQSTPTPDL